MEGSVYQLRLTNVDDGLPHPHVVVLTFSGNRDCIVVPAYSLDGFKINEYINAARVDGLPDAALFVQLDNVQHIDFTCHFPAKEAYWCTARVRRLSQSAVKQSKRLGQMKPGAMLMIAESLLAFSNTDACDLSGSAIKSLRNLVKGLTAPPSAQPPGQGAGI